MSALPLPAVAEGRNRPACAICPSILSADFSNLATESAHMLACGADWLHVDIMDGHFVPNLTIGAPVVKSLRKHTPAFLDCHLMVTHPQQWVKDYADAGANMYTFHIEAIAGDSSPDTPEVKAAMAKLCGDIRQHSMYVGVAIKPATPAEILLPYIHEGLIDMVLVMTVEPGFGGQKFNPEAAKKCGVLRQLFPSLQIQVDGGLAPSTVDQAAAAGANVIVAGTAVFGAEDPKQAIALLRSRVEAAST